MGRGRQRAWAVLALGAAGVLQGCGEHRDPIGRGYSYIGQDGRNSAIVDETGHYAVCSDVDRIAVEGEWVAGFRQHATANNADDSPPCSSQSFGYFLFDMRAGKLVGGLNETGLERAAASAGLKPGVVRRMKPGRAFG